MNSTCHSRCVHWNEKVIATKFSQILALPFSIPTVIQFDENTILLSLWPDPIPAYKRHHRNVIKESITGELILGRRNIWKALHSFPVDRNFTRPEYYA